MLENWKSNIHKQFRCSSEKWATLDVSNMRIHQPPLDYHRSSPPLLQFIPTRSTKYTEVSRRQWRTCRRIHDPPLLGDIAIRVCDIAAIRGQAVGRRGFRIIAHDVVNRQSPFLASCRHEFCYNVRANDNCSGFSIAEHVWKAGARGLLSFLREGARQVVDNRLALLLRAGIATLAAAETSLDVRPV